jgi:hypothetical protein
MSKFGCKCGHLILDRTDDLPYKGTVLPDKDSFPFYDRCSEQVIGYINALRDGKRDEWSKGYYQGFSDYDVILALIQMEYVRRKRDIYQCENGGRIHIQEAGSEHFLSFSPDDENWRDILKSTTSLNSPEKTS